MEDIPIESPPKRRFNPLTLLWFVLGFAVLFGFRAWQVQITEKTSPTPTPLVPAPTPTPFVLAPPSESISALLTSQNGEVKVALRDGNGYHEATPGSKLVEGEALAVSDGGAATLTLDNTVVLTLSDGGEISLSNLLPNALLFWQKNGTVLYAIPVGTLPVSVRVKRALLSLTPGFHEVTVGETYVDVVPRDGSATMGIVDLENETRISTVSAGQRATISDEDRTVEVRE